MIYKTYGFGQKPNKELIVTNLETTAMNKPVSAWWGSPVDAEFGWKQWCEREDYKECLETDCCEWKLAEGSKVLEIKTMEDLVELQNKGYLCKPKYSMRECLDFKKLLAAGFTAVYLEAYWMGHTMWFGQLDMMFNSWDCQSIVVLDASKIEFI